MTGWNPSYEAVDEEVPDTTTPEDAFESQSSSASKYSASSTPSSFKDEKNNGNPASASASASPPAAATETPNKRKPIFPFWTYLTEGLLHAGIRRVIVTLGTNAARYPKTWIASVTVCSFALAIIGFFTNFNTQFDQRVFLTPSGSYPDVHSAWIYDHERSGFEKLRVFWGGMHSKGDNVLTAEAIRRALIAMESVLEAPEFQKVCAASRYRDFLTNEPTCRIVSVTEFWHHNLQFFEKQLAFLPIDVHDDYVRWVVSNREYPNGTPVFHEVILGKYVNTTIKVDSDSGEIETQETLVAEQGQDQVHIQVVNVHVYNDTTEVETQAPTVAQHGQDQEKPHIEVLGVQIYNDTAEDETQAPTVAQHGQDQEKPHIEVLGVQIFHEDTVMSENTTTAAVNKTGIQVSEGDDAIDTQDDMPDIQDESLEDFTNATNSTAVDDSLGSSNRTAGRQRQLHWQLPPPKQQKEEGWLITSAQIFVIKIDIPDLGKESDPLEQDLLDRLGVLQDQWVDTGIELEYFTLNAYQQEFQRAMNQDLPLVVVLGAVMVSFVCFVFYRHKQKVHSRALLGLLSFATIVCSILTGYGIMFLAGVPLTSVGIMIPFLIVGVALDDTFIITGAYFRRQRDMQEQQSAATERKTERSDRNEKEEFIAVIAETLDEVAVSVFMTTLTTLLCFFTGAATTIPAVQWLCLYAATTIIVDFFYQVTFFIALMAMDEQRIQGNRRDLCFWIVVKDDEDDETDEGNKEEELVKCVPTASKSTDSADTDVFVDINLNAEEPDRDLKNDIIEEEGTWAGTLTVVPHDSTIKVLSDAESRQPQLKQSSQSSAESRPHHFERNFMERFMSWYADQLMKPWIKGFVIIAFAAYFGWCVYSTTLLYQEFNVGEYVPQDSFLTSFMDHFEKYTSIHRYIGVYFRNVDQSDPKIRLEMAEYVKRLSEMPQIGEPPPFFWVRDFPKLASLDQAKEMGIDIARLASLSFNDQVELALSIPQVRQVFDQDIVRDEYGNITASRTWLFLRELNMHEVKNQIEALRAQRDITLAQPANAGGGELAFFSFDDLYFFWELYDITPWQLTISTVTCVAVVSFVTLVLVPHWSAVVFVLPVIIVCYFDLLGTMQYCGLTINPISYFTIVMAIGLLVDFLMHILLRYYETPGATRHEKVKETLETMGASILLGGFTTWLSVIPLAFSTTKTFMTVFISFLAMVSLGCAVGLVLLPVLLSIMGPITTVTHHGSSSQLSKREV